MKKCIEREDWKQLLELVKVELKEINWGSNYNSVLKLSRVINKFPKDFLLTNSFLIKKIAILSGYTTNYLSPLLKVFLFKKGIIAELYESDYGIFESIAYQRDENLISFKPDLIYFFTGSEHLGENIDDEKKRWSNILNSAEFNYNCPILINNFIEPTERVCGNYDLKTKSKTNFIQTLNLYLGESSSNNIHLIDMNYIANLVGKLEWSDSKMYNVAKIPCTFDHLPKIAFNISNVISAIWGKTKKCIVLDLDNTLWGGVIGDDGLSGIKIGEDSGDGEAFSKFQKYLKQLKDRGIILAVCSKNDFQNAAEPFEKKQEMILKMEDISAFKANWEPKHQNIIQISHELSIGLDSMIFIDDNPAEREIVRINLPSVEVLEIGVDPSTYLRTLSHSGFLETVAITDEDLNRTHQYADNRKRNLLANSFQDYDEYLRNLQMKAIISKFDESNLARITQLVNKTNQFNLTTKRYSETQIREIMNSPNFLTFYVKLKDKFGDNGLISVLIVELKDGCALIDTWLMSCRVLKRSVEHLVFDHVIKMLIELNVKKLKGIYIKTEKNSMTSNLLSNLGMSEVGKENEKIKFELTLNEKMNSKEIYIQTVEHSQY